MEGRNEMDKHTKEVHKGLKVRCDMCDYVAKGARYMARHRLAKHDLPTAGFKLLKCELEGCKFSGCAAEEGSGKFDQAYINVKVV